MKRGLALRLAFFEQKNEEIAIWKPQTGILSTVSAHTLRTKRDRTNLVQSFPFGSNSRLCIPVSHSSQWICARTRATLAGCCCHGVLHLFDHGIDVEKETTRRREPVKNEGESDSSLIRRNEIREELLVGNLGSAIQPRARRSEILEIEEAVPTMLSTCQIASRGSGRYPAAKKTRRLKALQRVQPCLRMQRYGKRGACSANQPLTASRVWAPQRQCQYQCSFTTSFTMQCSDQEQESTTEWESNRRKPGTRTEKGDRLSKELRARGIEFLGCPRRHPRGTSLIDESPCLCLLYMHSM